MFEDQEYENNEEQTTEQEDIKLGKKSVMILLILLALIVFVVIVLIASCSVTKKVDSPTPKSTLATVQQTSAKETSIPVTKAYEFSSANSSTEIRSTEGSAEVEKSNGVLFEEIPVDSDMSKVVEGTGRVVETKMFVLDKSIACAVKIIVSRQSVQQEVWYFCPLKTFETLKGLGSDVVLTVSFSVDSFGNVSIYSISR